MSADRSYESAGDLAARHFVGALLHLDVDATRAAAATIAPEWIADVQVRGVYAAACQIAATGGRPEPAMIVPQMLRLGLPRQKHATATALVMDLYTGCPLPRNWRYYAATVADAHIRDEVHDLGRALADGAHRDPLDRLQALMDAARDQIDAAASTALRLAGEGDAA